MQMLSREQGENKVTAIHFSKDFHYDRDYHIHYVCRSENGADIVHRTSARSRRAPLYRNNGVQQAEAFNRLCDDLRGEGSRVKKPKPQNIFSAIMFNLGDGAPPEEDSEDEPREELSGEISVHQLLVVEEDRFALMRVNVGKKTGLLLVNLGRVFRDERETCHVVEVQYGKEVQLT